MEPPQFSERLLQQTRRRVCGPGCRMQKAAAVVFIKSKFVCLSQLGGGATSFCTSTPRNRRLCVPPPATSSSFRLFQHFHFFFACCFFPSSKSVFRRQAVFRDSAKAAQVPVLAENRLVPPPLRRFEPLEPSRPLTAQTIFLSILISVEKNFSTV